MDVGLSDLANQCRIFLLILRGTRCRVAEEICPPMVVREGDHGVRAELQAPSVVEGLVRVSAKGRAWDGLGLD